MMHHSGMSCRGNVGSRASRRVGKGRRSCAVPTILDRFTDMVGTLRFAHPYDALRQSAV